MIDATEHVAALYDWRHGLGGTTKGYMPIAQADVDLLAKHIDLVSATVCDVGCGGGTHLRALLGAGVRYPVGIDLSGRALAALLDTIDAERLVLVCGDVTYWGRHHAFDALICSLPPLAHEGRMCLRALTSTLHILLKPRGVLLLKVFTQESVPSIVGDYTVHYEGASALSHSHVVQPAPGHSIRIEQYQSDAPNDIWIEEVAVPSREDVLDALCSSGFITQQTVHHTACSLWGAETFIGRA